MPNKLFRPNRGKNTILYPREPVYPQDTARTASGQVQRFVHKLLGEEGPPPVTKVEKAKYASGTGRPSETQRYKDAQASKKKNNAGRPKY